MSETIEVCEVCGGNGEYEIPAHQEGGNVVDGQMVECECQKHQEGEKTTDEMVEDLKETVGELNELEKNRLFDNAMEVHEPTN